MVIIECGGKYWDGQRFGDINDAEEYPKYAAKAHADACNWAIAHESTDPVTLMQRSIRQEKSRLRKARRMQRLKEKGVQRVMYELLPVERPVVDEVVRDLKAQR